MNKSWIYTLKVLRKTYGIVTGTDKYKQPECEKDPQKAADIIYNALISEDACMIARFGANEMSCLTNYIGVTKQKKIF